MDRIKDTLRDFYLIDADLSGLSKGEHSEIGTTHLFLDRTASMLFRPARHLFHGRKVRWISEEDQVKVEVSDEQSKGFTKLLKTIGSVLLLLPFTVMGTIFEFIPFRNETLSMYKYLSSVVPADLDKSKLPEIEEAETVAEMASLFEEISRSIKENPPQTEEEMDSLLNTAGPLPSMLRVDIIVQLIDKDSDLFTYLCQNAKDRHGFEDYKEMIGKIPLEVIKVLAETVSDGDEKISDEEVREFLAASIIDDKYNRGIYALVLAGNLVSLPPKKLAERLWYYNTFSLKPDDQ